VVRLAEHWADAAHLKHQPLDRFEAFGFLLWQETPGFVREIQENRAGFEQRISLASGPSLSTIAGILLFGLMTI